MSLAINSIDSPVIINKTYSFSVVASESVFVIVYAIENTTTFPNVFNMTYSLSTSYY